MSDRKKIKPNENRRPWLGIGKLINPRKVEDELEAIESEVDKYLEKVQESDQNFPNGMSPQEFENLSVEERTRLKEEMPLPVQISDRWQDFVVNTGKTLQQIRDEMHTNYLKRIDRVRKRQKLAQNRQLERIQEREKRITARYQQEVREFEANNKELQDELLGIKQNFYNKKKEKRNAVFTNRFERQEQRAKAAAERQKRIKKTMKNINKWGWRQQLKIVLIILPFLIVLFIIYVLMRTFLPS